MARVYKKDVEKLVSLRDQIKQLKSEEQELVTKFKKKVEPNCPIRSAGYEIAQQEYCGAPDYKSAYIDLAGEDAAEALPRPTRTRLTVKPVGGKQ